MKVTISSINNQAKTLSDYPVKNFLSEKASEHYQQRKKQRENDLLEKVFTGKCS
jgi:hypothetical protein